MVLQDQGDYSLVPRRDGEEPSEVAREVAMNGEMEGRVMIGSIKRRGLRASVEVLEGRRLLAGYGIADLGTLGGASSHAFGVSASGQVVGDSITAGGQYTRVSLFRRGSTGFRHVGRIGEPCVWNQRSGSGCRRGDGREWYRACVFIFGRRDDGPGYTGRQCEHGPGD